jgi:hypothetical protein
MRNTFLILASAFLGCNSIQQEAKQSEQVRENDNCFAYPKVVDSLHIKGLYDSARWYVYTWHCDQNYLPKSDSSKFITFGELPLIFKSLNLKHDTIELNFSFMDKENAILPSMTRDVKELSTGVAFNIKSKQKIYMVSPNGFSTVIEGGANRFEAPLQPEVINYLQSHWNKLNICFQELAKRRGIKQ